MRTNSFSLSLSCTLVRFFIRSFFFISNECMYVGYCVLSERVSLSGVCEYVSCLYLEYRGVSHKIIGCNSKLLSAPMGQTTRNIMKSFSQNTQFRFWQCLCSYEYSHTYNIRNVSFYIKHVQMFFSFPLLFWCVFFFIYFICACLVYIEIYTVVFGSL